MESSLFKHILNLDGPVLVTGDTGFKGAWLSILLNHLGVEAIGASLPAERDSLFSRAALSKFGHHENVDIRDFDKVDKIFKKYKPSLVVHLAAQALVIDSYKYPRETFATNLMGTVNVLDAAFQQSKVRAIGVITTDKVYENLNKHTRFIETDRLGGKDPYSNSKVATESAVSAWQQLQKEFGGPSVVALRAGNVIGGGDMARNRLLPDIVRSFLANEKIFVRNPLSTRPWQHVLDPIFGYLQTLEAVLGGLEVKSLNFAPEGRSLSVSEVVKIAETSWGKELSQLDSESKFHPQEAGFLELNANLASNLIGWHPHWTQQEAVASTIKWWKDVEISKVPPVEACINEIMSRILTSN